MLESIFTHCVDEILVDQEDEPQARDLHTVQCKMNCSKRYLVDLEYEPQARDLHTVQCKMNCSKRSEQSSAMQNEQLALDLHKIHIGNARSVTANSTKRNAR